MDLSSFEFVPFWLRLIVNLFALYFATGLVLSLYQARRLVGDSVGSAIGAVLLAGFVTPYTAVKLLIDKSKASKKAATDAAAKVATEDAKVAAYDARIAALEAKLKAQSAA